MRTRLVLLVLACVATLSGTAGVAGAAGTPVATPQPEVSALLAKAVATMSAVTSYRFVLTYEDGKTTIYRQINMEKAEGAVQRPDRFQATVEAKLGPVTVDVDIVSVEGRVWVQVAGVEEEVGINEDVARVLLDPTAILIGAAASIRQPVMVGDEQIDGITATRIAGVADPSDLGVGAENPLLTTAGPLPVELTITDDGHIVGLWLDGALIRADSEDVVRRMDLSAFDQPVQIEAPA
ncbi:MAG TPA: LppX_LprAFG lipoprotein [Thermomicrobiales bacterium]|nr:LppX_LprAFG lipoprotein [Thermomicrobiales bacterium]